MMAGGPLKPGVGLSGLVRPPEQNCLAGRWPTQARCWLEWAGTAARTKLSSKVPGCPGSQQPFGRYPRSHLGQENPRDSRDVPISPPLQTWVCPRDIRGRATQTFHKIQLPERDRTDLNQSRTIVQAFFPV